MTDKELKAIRYLITGMKGLPFQIDWDKITLAIFEKYEEKK